MTALKAAHNCDFHRVVAVMTRPCVGHICDLLLGRRYAQVAVMPADLRYITATIRRSHGRRYDGYTCLQMKLYFKKFGSDPGPKPETAV